MITWQGLVVGACLYAALEAALMAGLPGQAREQMRLLAQMSDEILRWIGLLVLSIIAIIVWLVVR